MEMQFHPKKEESISSPIEIVPPTDEREDIINPTRIIVKRLEFFCY
jgi:hypothetical protein